MILARNTELDETPEKRCGQQVAGRVFRPAERDACEVIQETTAFDWPFFLEIVLDRDNRFVFELDLRLAARFGNQGKGILFGGHAVERRGEKLLGQPGIGLERRLGIPMKNLRCRLGKISL